MADNGPFLILGREQVRNVMRDRNEIKMIHSRHFHQRLEAGHVHPVIAEEISKFIPDKHDGIQIVFCDDGANPVLHIFFGQRQHLDAPFPRYLHHFPHDFGQGKPIIGFQLMNQRVRIIAAKYSGVSVLHKRVEIRFIGWIVQPGQSGGSQGPVPFRISVFAQGGYDAVLHVEQQIRFRHHIGGGIAVNRQDAARMLEGIQPVI